MRWIERRKLLDNFRRRLDEVTAKYSRLCLGIDPSESELIEWDLPDNAAGAREYGLRCVDAAAGRVGIIKPQVGFFERFGSAGFLALEQILDEARSAGLLVIADAKRGDIGSTMLGYAQAWFGDDSPLRSDSLTVSGYLGPDSLEEMLEYASDVQGGLFVLCATSNPEAKQLQTARIGNKTVSKIVLEAAQKAPERNLGLVIGATQQLADFGLESILATDCEVPILAPGFGAQGAKLSQLEEKFGASSHRVIASMSRGLTSGGPSLLKDSIERAKAEL
jgi:orotidine-5'-phosphate decarboxylase